MASGGVVKPCPMVQRDGRLAMLLTNEKYPPTTTLLLFIRFPTRRRDGGMRGGQEREQQAGGIRLPKGRPADRADVTGSDRRALAGAPGPSTSRGNHLNLTSTHLPEVCMVAVRHATCKNAGPW